jgi:hypothetical protein
VDPSGPGAISVGEVSSLRTPIALLVTLALVGCGRGNTGGKGQPVASAAPSAVSPASVSPASSSAAPPSAAPPPASASAPPFDPPAPSPPPGSFVGAKAEKGCKAQTTELATYQPKGEVWLAAQKDTFAAAWRVRIAGKSDDQVAFASFDADAKPIARARGVGTSAQETQPRVLATGSDWAVVWFDDKGLAYARPRTDPLPAPEVSHLGAVGPDVASDVALSSWPLGGVLAAAPFGAGKEQIGLFVFAPADPGAPAVRAFGVTHHSAALHRPAIAADDKGIFVAWDEGGAILSSRFDAAGKESAAACTLAPAGGPKRERLALVATATGAMAMWMEGGAIRTRVLDRAGCPTSPAWTVAEGRWASLTALGAGALVAWTASDGKLLAARLAPTGAPPERGLEASEGSSGVKDAPSVVTSGGRAAFAWAEVMSPIISTKRIVLRVLDAACIP